MSSLFNNKGNSLVGILIVTAIIAVAVLYFAGLLGNKSDNGLFGSRKVDTMKDFSNSQKETVYGQSMDAAKAVECQSNIKQIRDAVNMYVQSNGQNPASLQELNLPQSMLVCPVSKSPINYDPQTGRVSCPTHPNF